ncbi:MAG TPA: di-heme oxidoredictase family protein [Polyangiaceae bacterium]|nr:di-heme oxidoredictase family protein [Polyangiaceae bacterium]
MTGTRDPSRRAGTGALVLAGLFACGSDPQTTPPASPVTASSLRSQQSHSSSLVASPDGSLLFVVHPDADSVSILRVATRTILHEVALAPAGPSVSATGRYDPGVGPRALAIDSVAATLYVTGQRSGKLYAVDVASGSVKASAAVCSEPIGVLVSADDADVFVACAQDDELVELRTIDLGVVATAPCPRKPWALAWAADQTLLATHLLGPGVSAFGATPLALKETWTFADGPPQPAPDAPEAGEDPTEPHGIARGLYDVAVRPGTSEIWVPHLMLGTDTPQPALDFQQTVFPSLSILDAGGTQLARLSVVAHPGDGQAFGDVVSGPRALAFSDDGAFAAVVDTDSEDVLVVDAARRIEAELVRPLPGHMPEGIVWLGDELYVQERNTEDVAAFRVSRAGGAVSIDADGSAFPSLTKDPMPANLRLGQRLFYSANSDEYPLTQNHWVACASCHLEGRSDAVTWQFAQGPRDTPTNAGGLLDTGFLFRTADRNQVQDYWRTINTEQGGHFDIDQPSQKPLLDALAQYVNEAIPTPVPPSTDVDHAIRGQALTALRAQGEAVFTRIGCDSCHNGPAKTDSGAGNPSLDLAGPTVSSLTTGGVLLHDVGTCVTTGPSTDVAHDDIDGHPRDACAFDTPALRGLADSAPYLHDGSAATLDAVVPIMQKAMQKALAAAGRPEPPLSASDERALVEYLRGL